MQNKDDKHETFAGEMVTLACVGATSWMGFLFIRSMCGKLKNWLER